VVWLDDAHLGSDTLDFCRFLLETQTADPVPVLLLISVQDDALSQSQPTDTARVLAAIEDHPRCQTIELEPLTEDDQVLLVRELIGIEGELVERVAARTAGSPGFAVQLVADWVAGGLLRPGQDGFQLAEGASVELPAGVEREWDDRLERLLVGFRPAEAQGLELAAVLGAEVDRAEWGAVCALADLQASDRVVERLVAQKLAAVTHQPAGFAFSRTLLRDALVRRARNAGRLRTFHGVCAEMLSGVQDSKRGVAERLGRHLLMAGNVVPALGKLLDGARERQRSGETAAARRLLDYRERALRQLDLPPTDQLWGLGWVERADLDLESDRIADAEPLLNKTWQAAKAHGWSRAELRARVVRGRLHLRSGNLPQAIEVLSEARQEAERRGNTSLAARTLVELAVVHIRLGQLDAASADLTTARGLYRSLGDEYGLACCGWHFGRLAMARCALDDARKFIEAARTRFSRVGARAGKAECTNGLGDLYRMLGQSDQAENYYRQAMQELDAIGHASAAFPRLNLGVVLVEREKAVAARRLIEPLLRSPTIRSRPALAAGAHLVLLAAVADSGDWSAWDHHVGRAGALLASTGIVDRDNALLAQIGGERAVRGGEVDRARSAFGLAWQQLDALGDTAAVERIEERVRALA
jgi:tetratricopeptide (TPR) repeat protein